MKIVVNKCYGGFGLPADVAEELHTSPFDDRRCIRTDIWLVKQVEENPVKFKDDSTELGVVEIPNEATDWIVVDYDGKERVYYTANGKILRAT